MKGVGLFRRFGRSTRGIAAIEFAMIAPVVLTMAAGIFEFGMYFQALDATNKLASEYAASWSDCSDYPTGTCQTELGYYTAASAITNLAPRLVAANTSLRMFQVTVSGATISTVYASPSGATLSATETAAINNKLSSGSVGIVATVTYTYTLFFGQIMSPILGNKLTMTSTVVQLK